MKKLIAGIILLLNSYALFAQHQELNEKPAIWMKSASYDTTSLLQAFKHGSFNGGFRYFFMATDNTGMLRDYYANAAGGGLRFESGKFHGFQVAVSGYYIFNLASSDFAIKDSITGLGNRYEIGLFDINDPSNKKSLDRLEELHLRYSYKNFSVALGRQLLNTPFINLQDGRMRPGTVEGLYAEYAGSKLHLYGGWLYSFSPRSTTKWYSAKESIGLYSTGVNPDGSKSSYSDNLQTKGVLINGIQYRISNKLELVAWNLLIDNILNSSLLQLNYTITHRDMNYDFAVQAIRQDAINEGGNADQKKTYVTRGASSNAFGAKAAFRYRRVEGSINYNRITAHGRYLMPREWGRDPFFTFLPRERNEGYGDVHAFMARLVWIPKANLKTSFAAGYYSLPSITNYRLNKYGFPSYYQINGDVRYYFEGALEGMDAQLLVAGKMNAGETLDNYKNVLNKVDMVNYNLVLNFRF
jgi:hypothetical protein